MSRSGAGPVGAGRSRSVWKEVDACARTPSGRRRHPGTTRGFVHRRAAGRRRVLARGAPRRRGDRPRRVVHVPAGAPGHARRRRRRPGLSRLIELHAFNSAGDAAVAISLAGTLFFQVPTDQARGQVALFLGLTMLPFAIVAPLIGPILDRYGHGRRWAIGATMALRAFLCWVLADGVASGSLVVFPAALGVLVASKAYGVTRAAAVPRLLPEQLTLVKANSRISLAGTAGRHALRAPGRRRGDARRAVVLALRLRALRRGHDPRGAAAAPGRQRARRGTRVALPRHPPLPRAASRRAGAALQRRAADALGLPDHVHGVPAPGEAVPRLGGPAGTAARARDRGRRPRQHGRDSTGQRAARRAPRGVGGGRAGRGRGGDRRGGGVLRAADGGAARPDRRTHPVLRQAVPGRAHPARGGRTNSGERLRPLGDAAPAVVGARRLRRDRAAAGAARRAGRGRGDPRRLGRLGAHRGPPYPAPVRAGGGRGRLRHGTCPARAPARRPARAAPWRCAAPPSGRGAGPHGSRARHLRAGGTGPR